MNRRELKATTEDLIELLTSLRQQIDDKLEELGVVEDDSDDGEVDDED